MSNMSTRTPSGKLLRGSNCPLPKDPRPNMKIAHILGGCLENAKRFTESPCLAEKERRTFHKPPVTARQAFA